MYWRPCPTGQSPVASRPISTEIDAREHWRTAWQAVACHRSQLPTYARMASMTPEAQRALWGTNQYRRVFSTVPVSAAREDDLFAGLRPRALAAAA